MSRAENRKYHYIYKITRDDGKYYIGMHSTDDLEDGYFGSGKLLWHSINYHGKNKHQKEIVEFLSSRKELKERERVLVNEEILDDPLCMNLKLGGEGGGGFWNEDHSKKFIAAGILARKAALEKYPAGSSFRKDNGRKAGQTRKLRYAVGDLIPTNNRRGLRLSETSKISLKKTLSERRSHDGEKNSQYGTCWISHELIGSKKCKKELLPEFIEQGWTKGRNKFKL